MLFFHQPLGDICLGSSWQFLEPQSYSLHECTTLIALQVVKKMLDF